MPTIPATLARSLRLVALGLALASQGRGPTPDGAGSTGATTVARIIDGDTLVTSTGSHVRLAGVDAPERGQPSPWATYATDRLRSLTLGRPVSILPEPGARDPYGRTIARITVGGRDVGEDLVGWGLAYAWVPRGQRHPADWDALQRAERWAQATQVGVWSDPQAIRPDQWRRRRVARP
jgi:micrococcal nuclease